MSVPRALIVPDAGTRNPPGNLGQIWEKYCGGTAAVRSSGSDEDGEGASAAGQFETFLNVLPENLCDAVKKCAASAGSDRVSTYEQELSGTEGATISVVIQGNGEPVTGGCHIHRRSDYR